MSQQVEECFSRGNSSCKCPETGECLTCWISKVLSVTGTEWAKGRAAGSEIRDWDWRPDGADLRDHYTYMALIWCLGSHWRILSQGVLSDLHFKVTTVAALRRLKWARVGVGNSQDARTAIVWKMRLAPSGSCGHHERWSWSGCSKRPIAFIGILDISVRGYPPSVWSGGFGRRWLRE